MMMTIQELLNSKKELELAFDCLIDAFEVDPDGAMDISNLEFNLYEFKGILEKFDEDLAK